MKSENLEGIRQPYGHDIENVVPIGLRHRLPGAWSTHRARGEGVASLVYQLLTFGRKQALRSEWLDLGEVAADMEKMLRRVIIFRPGDPLAGQVPGKEGISDG